MSFETIECGYPECRCMVSAPVGERTAEPLPAYCSENCRDAAETREETMICTCGHPPCDSP